MQINVNNSDLISDAVIIRWPEDEKVTKNWLLLNSFHNFQNSCFSKTLVSSILLFVMETVRSLFQSLKQRKFAHVHSLLLLLKLCTIYCWKSVAPLLHNYRSIRLSFKYLVAEQITIQLAVCCRFELVIRLKKLLSVNNFTQNKRHY